MTAAFSVLMSVYKKEKPNYLKACLDSLEAQTQKATEYVIIEDGRLTPELDAVIADFQAKTKQEVSLYRFENNRGLGSALADGVRLAKHELIARMDTDDIAHPDRFEKQLAFFQLHPEATLVGSYIDEFSTDIEQPDAKKTVPLTPTEITAYAGKRNPFNHMTVMYKKQAVLAAGNYQPLPGYEDYYLWVRMLKNGGVAYNIPESLVSARADEAMYQRRGGWEYFKDGVHAYNRIYRVGLAKPTDRIVRLGGQFVVNLIPNNLRSALYRRTLRQSPADDNKKGSYE